MDKLMGDTRAQITEFTKSVDKLNLHSDRLVLEAEKRCCMSLPSQLREERYGMDTKQAIKLILEYAQYLEVVKSVDQRKKEVSTVEYAEYKEKSLKTLDTLKTDVIKLKLFQEYSNRIIESLEQSRESDMESSVGSSFHNSYSFS